MTLQYMNVTMKRLYPGQTVFVDAGFTCVDAGPVTIKWDDWGPYFDCDCGHHHIEGQENEHGTLSGLSLIGDPTVSGRLEIEEYDDEN